MLVTNKSASARREPKIVAHNHPSGNLNPSESDIKITTKIKEAGNLLDIQLLDHLIIYDSEFYSFADNGLL